MFCYDMNPQCLCTTCSQHTESNSLYYYSYYNWECDLFSQAVAQYNGISTEIQTQTDSAITSKFILLYGKFFCISIINIVLL